jgi:hypothetical protein
MGHVYVLGVSILPLFLLFFFDREKEWDNKISLPRQFVLMCLYQDRKVSGHVYVLGVMYVW